MEQLDILWEYQELDMIVDQYENDIKSSASRKQLLKLKRHLVDRDQYLVKLDEEAYRKNDNYNKILREYENIQDTISNITAQAKSGEEKSLDELEQMLREGLILQDKLRKNEAELKKLLDELKAFRNELDDIRVKVSQAKKQYASIKKEYDSEVLKIKQEQDEVKEKRDKLAADIDKALLAKYNNLKITRTPVIAILENDQCSGCFMSLASLVVQNVKDGKRIVECENCGRLLYNKTG